MDWLEAHPITILVVLGVVALAIIVPLVVAWWRLGRGDPRRTGGRDPG